MNAGDDAEEEQRNAIFFYAIYLSTVFETNRFFSFYLAYFYRYYVLNSLNR